MYIQLSVLCLLLMTAKQTTCFKPFLRQANSCSLITSYRLPVSITDNRHSSLQMASRDTPNELTKVCQAHSLHQTLPLFPPCPKPHYILSPQTSIDAPTMNSRKITASIIVNSPIDDVWSIITDYNHLAVHVPNLVKSYVIAPDGNSASPALPQSSFIATSPTSRSNENKNVRIFQEGAQKIVGFDFRASLTIDMREEEESEGRALKEKKLIFKLAESSMFSSFDGSWSIRYHSRVKEFDSSVNDYVFRYKTLLTYSVLVKPKGPVPVIALEWRIKEDVPINLIAMKMASEKVTAENRLRDRIASAEPCRLTTQWGADETLGIYIRNTKGSAKEPSSAWDAKSSSATSRKPLTYPTDEEDVAVLTKRLDSVLNVINAARQSSIAR
jgi:Polyketide cyclase / dehydrase and lipid transport